MSTSSYAEIQEKTYARLFLPMVFIASIMLNGCSNEEKIGPERKSLSSAKQNPNDLDASGKPGKVIGPVEELGQVTPSEKPPVATPSIETEKPGSTSGVITGSTATPATPPTTSTVPVVTTPVAYESGQVTRARQDGSMAVQIELIGDGGAVQRTVKFENPEEGSSNSMTDMCRKGGVSKWKVSFVAGTTKVKGDKCYFVVSNNQSNAQLDVDMRGDSDGCKPGEDDQFKFSCPNGTIEFM